MTIIGEPFALPTEPWVERANCVGTDFEIFFPDKGGSTRDAKIVCGRCDVREACLQAAFDRDERFGVWGGYSERERWRLGRGETVPLMKPEQPRTPVLRDHTCARCGDPFRGLHQARYCSQACKLRAEADRYNARRRAA